MLNIFRGIDTYTAERNACVTTGTFDGVHLGHRKILTQLATHAKSLDLESVMVTFDPHPRKVLFPDQPGLKLLTTLDEKLELLEGIGINTVIVQPFTMEFSRTTALHYVRDLLVSTVKMKQLVIGYDHQFGKNREGSIDQLRELAPLYGFTVEEIPAQDIDEVKISSTKIRYALEEGDIQTANSYLSYPFFITGTVVKGKQRGSGMGFPTANVHVPDPEKIIPKIGVYAVKVEVGGRSYNGMLNIGYNPTFGDASEPTIEAHLFDFNESIYDQEIKVSIYQRIRAESRFESTEALVRQMKRDESEAKKILQ